MRPGKRAAVLRRAHENEIADRAAWKKAGKPRTFDLFAAHREGVRTKAKAKLRVALSHVRAQIFGYEDAEGNETFRVAERHMLEGSNPDHRSLLAGMMRDRDPRWLDYLDAAEDLGVDYDEAADTWFSPEV